MSADLSPGSGRTGIIVSLIALFALIALAAIIRVNWDRVSVRKYEMNVAFDGKAPWGEVGPESDGEPAPTVLYRMVGKSYCYTAFQLADLRSRLKQANNTHVAVEYNVFATFGHEGKYTLRSVDGVPLADGNRVIQRTREFGGQVLLNGDEALSCP